MRRVLATAVLGLAFFATAACADKPMDPAASPSAGNTAAAKADKKTSCDAYKKLETDVVGKLGPYAMKAADPSKVTAEDIAAIMKIVKDSETELKTIASNAGDPELKAALDAEVAAQSKVIADLTAAGTDINKALAALDSSDEEPGKKIKTLCA